MNWKNGDTAHVVDHRGPIFPDHHYHPIGAKVVVVDYLKYAKYGQVIELQTVELGRQMNTFQYILPRHISPVPPGELDAE